MEKKLPNYAQLLIEARKSRKLTHKQISENLNIKPIFLQAIEDGNIGLMPKEVYSKGFVRSYANYLNLDAEMISMLFIQYLQRDEYKIQLNKQELDLKKKALIQKIYIIFGIIVFILSLAYMIFFVINYSKNSISESSMEKNTQTKSAITKEEIIVEDNLINEEDNWFLELISKNNEIIARMPPESVIITALSETWIEIKDPSSTILTSNILQKGESYLVPDKPDLELSVGKASAVIIHYGHEKWFSLGKENIVLRKIKLNYDDIRKLAFNLE